MPAESPSPPSVTEWIARLKNGDRGAAERIWHRFAARVRGLARSRMAPRLRRLEDEEDVAQSVMHAVCRGLEAGRLEYVDDRDDLWQLFAVVTCRRVARTARRDRGRPEVGESALPLVDPLERILEKVGRDGADPDLPADFLTSCEELVEELEPWLRPIVLARLAGFSNSEIALREDRSVKTIERYIAMARRQWDRTA